MSFDKAWSSLQKQVPAHFLSNPLDLPLADKIAGMIFIGCGLGIAYLFELEREGVQLFSLKEFDNILESLHYNPLNGLHQTSLNIQSLLEDGQKEIMTYSADEDGKDERMFTLVMDVIEELPLSPQKEVMDMVKEIYIDQPVVRSIVDWGSEMMLNWFLLPVYHLPKVQQAVQDEYQSQRIDDWADIYWYLAGMKDGTVGVTGSESKLALCNGNVSTSIQVYTLNFEPYYNDPATSFNKENWNITMTKLADFTGRALRWPFHTVYNCYWAANDLIYRYDNLLVPLFFQE